MAEAPDINVDELRRRARRRLIGAIVLALAAAVIVPMLLESDPKPLGEDVSVKIPPEDSARFVNRLSDKAATDKSAKATATDPLAKSPGVKETARESAKDSATTTPVTDPAPTAPVSGGTAVGNTTGGPAATIASAQPTNVPPPKKSLAQAEQKMLGATGKPAVPSATATPTATAPAPAATAAPAMATPTTADAPREGFSVQLAAFADDKGANSLANKLKKAAYPAYTEPLTTSKGTLWRVRVGPYSSRDEAVGVRDKLKGEGYSGIVAAAR